MRGARYAEDRAAGGALFLEDGALAEGVDAVDEHRVRHVAYDASRRATEQAEDTVARKLLAQQFTVRHDSA